MSMTQRGLLSPALIQLILWGVAAAAVMGAVWWVVDTWRDGRAAVREVEAIKAEVFPGCRKDTALECAREVKAALADCETREKALLALIAKQNAAIQELETKAKQAQARATAALARADKAATATLVERERLEALILAGNAPGECPAGQAVSQVRQGLRP